MTVDWLRVWFPSDRTRAKDYTVHDQSRMLDAIKVASIEIRGPDAAPTTAAASSTGSTTTPVVDTTGTVTKTDALGAAAGTDTYELVHTPQAAQTSTGSETTNTTAAGTADFPPAIIIITFIDGKKQYIDPRQFPWLAGELGTPVP